MDLHAVYAWGVRAEISLALVALPALLFITVPYGGRHTSDRWGPSIPSWLAWILMEAPAPLFCLAAYLLGARAGEPVSLVLLAAFLVHYAERTMVDPLRLRGGRKRTPVLSASVAMAANALNGSITGLALGHVESYGVAWLGDPRFLVGAALFGVGAVVNRRSDSILRGLRPPGETGYCIPSGGLYRWVSSPNYLGEIVQWAGWAVATASGAGLAFLLLTIANLVPRARANHRWYRETFPDYPAGRRALIPGVW